MRSESDIEKLREHVNTQTPPSGSLPKKDNSQSAKVQQNVQERVAGILNSKK